MAPFSSLDEARRWLRQFECPRDDPSYTHSSMRGARDWVTSSGRLRIPDTEDAQRQLFDAISLSYRNWRPMCFVEMCTERRPFIEDIDILGSSNWDDSPPDDLIIESDFFKLRAKELRRLCPQIASLELTLFTASGWHRDKECYKASFHAIWRELVVTESLAGILRSETVASFKRLSEEEEPLKSLQRKLLDLSPKNTWDMVFDITSVRAGSFRMPFCDKFAQGAREKREVRPVGVYMFEFGEPSAAENDSVKQVSLIGPADLSEIEWLRRGTVRRPHDPPPPLVKLAPSIELSPGYPVDGARQAAHSSSPSLPQQVIDTLEGTSRWMRPAAELRDELNRRCGDLRGVESTWGELPSKPEEQRWQWKSKRKDVRGCVELRLPSGEIVVRGAEQQKARLHLLLQEIARPQAVMNTSVQEKRIGLQQDRRANVSKGSSSNIPGKAWDIPRYSAGEGETGSVRDRFLMSLCSSFWQSELLGAVSCRRGRGQMPMTDIFPVAKADSERAGCIIIVGEMVLLQTSDGLQLQLQGTGLGRRLLWQSLGDSPMEDLWVVQQELARLHECGDETLADASGTSAGLLPSTSSDQVPEGGSGGDTSSEDSVDGQDEPDPGCDAGTYEGPWHVVQRRRQRPRIDFPKLAEPKDPTTPTSQQQKNYNRRLKRRKARVMEAMEAELRKMEPPPLHGDPASPLLSSSLSLGRESWAAKVEFEQLEPAIRVSRWQRRAIK